MYFRYLALKFKEMEEKLAEEKKAKETEVDQQEAQETTTEDEELQLLRSNTTDIPAYETSTAV